MKSTAIILLILSAFHFCVLAQTPEKINYQSVLRDNTGEPMPNYSFNLRASFLQGSPAGTVVYSEIHKPATNALGLFTLQLGTGLVATGDFETIDWGSSEYFLRIEVDMVSNNNYITIGTQQLI